MKIQNLIASVMLVWMSCISSYNHGVEGQSLTDLLNQLQQQTGGLNLNDLSSSVNQVSSLVQTLQQNGFNLNDINSLQQNLAQAIQLNQLGQIGQQLNAATSNINALLTSLSNIDWNQLLSNPTSAVNSQLAQIQAQVISLLSNFQSINQILQATGNE